MKINIIRMAKEVFKDKKLIIKELKNNKVKINYLAKRGNYNRKSFIFSREIKIDENFIEGIGLFLGDGDFNRKEKRHTTFASKDKDIAKFYLDFIKDKFNISNKDLTLTILYKKENKNLEEEWSKALNINKTKFYKKFSDRHRDEALHIQINGIVFRLIFEYIINRIIKSNFVLNKYLRIAFLRGIFAAEGSIGIDYLEKKPYISQITFNLNINEDYLRELICKSLDKESISYKVIKDKKDNSLEINIQNWLNYIKLWDVLLFDICQRKKNKFIMIAKNLDIYMKFNLKFRKKFFDSLNMNQRKIANIIGSWQGNVCRIIDGTHLLRIEQMIKLVNYSNYNKRDIVNNLQQIRIGKLTNLKFNGEILYFLKEYKLI